MIVKEKKDYTKDNSNSINNSIKEIKSDEVPSQNIGGQNQTGNNNHSNESQNLSSSNLYKSNKSNNESPYQSEVHNSINENILSRDPVIFYIINREEDDMDDLRDEEKK